VKALADETVGRYVNEHFVAAVQKVGTFRLVNGTKAGGNVATYFCLPDRTVLHVVPGPVSAATLLKEARWAVETRELARLTATAEPNSIKAYGRYKVMLRQAHADRLETDHGVRFSLAENERKAPTSFDVFGDEIRSGRQRTIGNPMHREFGRPVSGRVHSRQGRAHELLAVQNGSETSPLLRLEQVYKIVFEKFLGEKVSTLPVQEG
jgi:hypothetical protein